MPSTKRRVDSKSNFPWTFLDIVTIIFLIVLIIEFFSIESSCQILERIDQERLYQERLKYS